MNGFSTSTSKGPLDGITVLDLSRILAGPYCTQLLGDMGADVIKIEHPINGDDTRAFGPPFSSTGQSTYFQALNRNKRSVAIDMKKEAGLDLIHQLCKRADIVVENFPPGKADALGVGYDRLCTIKPDLIYASITGFGRDGPYKDRLAYDMMVVAQGGMMSITGPEDGPPCRPGVAITDISAGLFLHGAILAALFNRQRTGKGQRVDTSLLEAQVATLSYAASNYLNGGVITKPGGTKHPSIVPYQGFSTADGSIIIGALNDSQFIRLCEVVGIPSLAHDPLYSTNPARVKNRDALIAILQDRVRDRTTAQWIDVLEQAKIPCGPINNIQQVFEDKQVLHRQMILQAQHPVHGTVKLVGMPVKYGETPTTVRAAPPELGEHTNQVLRSMLNLTEERLNALERDGVIATTKAATTSTTRK